MGRIDGLVDWWIGGEERGDSPTQKGITGEGVGCFTGD